MPGLIWQQVGPLTLWEDKDCKLSKNCNNEYVLEFSFEERNWLTFSELEKLIPALEEWVQAAKNYMST